MTSRSSALLAPVAATPREVGRSWLTTRLFLFAHLLARMRGLQAVVFVHGTAVSDRTFLGVAPASSVRWRLAQQYPELEIQLAHAYNQALGPLHDGPRAPVIVSNSGALEQFLRRELREGVATFEAAAVTGNVLTLTMAEHPGRTLPLGWALSADTLDDLRNQLELRTTRDVPRPTRLGPASGDQRGVVTRLVRPGSARQIAVPLQVALWGDGGSLLLRGCGGGGTRPYASASSSGLSSRSCSA